MLGIHVLGRFTLMRNGRPVTDAALRDGTSRALLKYLVVNRGQTVPQEVLIEEFWPESSPGAGRASLHAAISHLRRALEPGLEQPARSRTLLRLSPGYSFRPGPDGEVDVDQYLAWAALAEARASEGDWSGVIQAAVAAERMVEGEFLACEPYADWAEGARNQFRRRRADLLELSLVGHTELEQWQAAVETARRALAVDRLREGFYRQQMLAYSALHEPALALRTYDECRRVLAEELGTEPAPATVALHRQLLARGVQMAVAASRPDTAPVSPLPLDLPYGLLPSRTAGEPPHNLPLQLTTFVGRERELSRVNRMLSETRLLTLVGAGGCGKTRLALRAADSLRQAFADGAWLVELAALAEPRLVEQAVAAALGVHEQPDRPLAETISEFLRSRHLLLLLDNCEHLVEACAGLAHALLTVCPHLRILATSREPLGVPGEMAWRVPSLSLPGPDERVSPEALAQCEAIRLFVDRARVALPGFRLDAASAPAVAQICSRLDGIPLAIELAAARTRLLPVEQIAARLDDRFNLLSGGSRTLLPRQQTLRALVDWSHDLLSPAERTLWQRLSVFAGGFTIGAAEAVCASDDLSPHSLLQLLSQLVDKSLVLVDEAGTGRYRLLETIRQYGAERLGDSGEAPMLRRRHLGWYVGLAEQAAAEMTGPDQRAWLDRLEQEHDNVRTALQFALESGDADQAVRLGGDFWRFWYVRGHYREGREWLTRVLAMPRLHRDSLGIPRARALNGIGVMAYSQGDYAGARQYYEQSLSIWRSLDDQQGIAAVLNNLGLVARMQGHYPEARALLEEAVAENRAQGNRTWESWNRNNLGNLLADQGDLVGARGQHQASLAIQREIGDRWGTAMSLHYLANVANGMNNPEEARSVCEESLHIRRELGDRRGIANCLATLGETAWLQDDLATASALFRQSLTLRYELGDRSGIAAGLDSLAGLAATLDQPELALRLAGAADALRAAAGIAAAPAAGAERERRLERARAALTPAAAAAAYAAGQALKPERAIALAGQLSGPTRL